MQHGFTVMNTNSNNNRLKQGNSEDQSYFSPSPTSKWCLPPPPQGCSTSEIPIRPLCNELGSEGTGPGPSPPMVKMRATLTMGRNFCGLAKEGMTAGVSSHVPQVEQTP